MKQAAIRELLEYMNPYPLEDRVTEVLPPVRGSTT